MNIATIKVSGVKAVTNDYPTIPAGIVGATVTFEFTDPAWDGLNKTAVFRGCVTRDVLMTGNVVRIPAETVAQACPFLFVGVYGTDAADNLVIPTLWLSLGTVRDAADPSGDPGTDPDLPIWAQLQDRVEALESGAPSDPGSPGTPGRPGEDGEDGGYYTPAVTQPSSDTVEFAFSPSKPDMPAVDPVQVKLPVGQGSGGNVELDTTLTQSGKAADAKAVGDKFSALSLKQHTDGLVYIFINGKPVGSGLSITTVPGDIQITDIVSYYREQTMAVADEINALDEDWVSFIAITDTHTEWNKNNSQNIIRYLLKNTPANKMFHLGDISDSYSEDKYKAWFAPFENCKHQLFYAKGNHEPSNPVAVYEDILADKVYLVGKPESFYYYFDDNARKVRYMVINTSALDSTQIAWMRESAQLPSTDWKLLAFGHIDINPNYPISGRWIPANASDVVSAFSSTNGKFVGYFCGHEHHDRIVFINETIYQTILINDSCRKDTELPNWTNPERTAGTTSEHAVSVVSFNTVTGAVDIRRIGVGSDMAYNYLEQSEEPEVTLTSISATYSGGDVAVGTAVDALTGISVTAHYSDGTSETVTGYTLSGAIVEGSNTITVSYEGMTATFTVVGIAEPDEPDVPESGLVAVYNPTKQCKDIVHIVFDTDTPDSLRDYLTVTNADGEEVTDYTLSGDFSNGNNVITVSYGGMTCNCEVPLMKWEMDSNALYVGGADWSYHNDTGMFMSTRTDRCCYPLFVRAKTGYTYTLVMELADSVSVYVAFEYYSNVATEHIKNMNTAQNCLKSGIIERGWTRYSGAYTDNLTNADQIETVRFVMKGDGFTNFNGTEVKKAVLTVTPIA